MVVVQIHIHAFVGPVVVGRMTVDAAVEQLLRRSEAVDIGPVDQTAAAHVAAEQAAVAHMLAGHMTAPLAAGRTHIEDAVAELVVGGIVADMGHNHSLEWAVADTVGATGLPS